MKTLFQMNIYYFIERYICVCVNYIYMLIQFLPVSKAYLMPLPKAWSALSNCANRDYPSRTERGPIWSVSPWPKTHKLQYPCQLNWLAKKKEDNFNQKTSRLSQHCLLNIKLSSAPLPQKAHILRSKQRSITEPWENILGLIRRAQNHIRWLYFFLAATTLLRLCIHSYLAFWELSLCSQGWPWSLDNPPASASWVLVLQECTIIHSLNANILSSSE